MRSDGTLNYQSIFDMITLPFLVADSDKRILFANDQSLSLLEMEKSQVSNSFLHTVFEIQEKEIDEIEKALLDDKPYFGTCLFKHKNDEFSEIQVLVKGIRIPTKTRLGFYVELKKAQKIELSDDDLKRLGIKTGKIAHEISNPLAVLRIHCDNFSLLAQKNKSFTSREVLDRVKTLSSATDRLSMTNDELKKLSKTMVNLDMNQLKSMIETDRGGPEGFGH